MMTASRVSRKTMKKMGTEKSDLPIIAFASWMRSRSRWWEVVDGRQRP